MKRITIIIVLLATLTAKAQRVDTTKKTVVVTSAFKPTIKPAAKINFSAASPTGDTTRPTLVYNVPAQNLFFTYQPVPLKPLALSIDTTLLWENDNYIKVGYGNFKTPFAQAGFSFGDGNGSAINIHTKHISQKGNLPFQQYSRSNADVIGVFNTSGNNEVRAKVGFETSGQYFYGYQPETLSFTKDALKQRFTNFNAMAGLRNKVVNQYGVSYDPSVGFSLFGDNHGGRETNFSLNAPLTKSFGKAFAFNLGFNADLTNFKTGAGTTIKNNLYYIVPAVLLKTPNFKLTAGFTPSWDNQKFNLLPNFTVDAKVKNEKFILQGGWIGYYQKNTYRSLAAFNPWIVQPNALNNTRTREQFAGFKGSAGSHLTYNARVSVLRFSNAVLFVNDANDGRTFIPVYEPDMNSLRLHGEIGYTVQEKFSFLAGATMNQYSGMQNNSKAFGLLPLEVTGALRWQILKDFHLKSDLFFWDGPRYLNKFGSDQKSKAAFDLNAGVEFTVLPKLNLWVQFNNILNNRYERWNQYQVLGFNAMGGIVYNFSSGKK